MKRLITVIATVVALTLPAMAWAAVWDIDPVHSHVGFSVRHLMIANVKGLFEKFAGTVTIDEKDITKSGVEVSIDIASINTNVQKRDEHLRSADFFDVAKYPTMTFVSKKVAKAGKNRFKVTGDLTLHGVTQQVVLDVRDVSKETKDPWGGIRRGATVSTKIRRSDFGMTWNEVLESGGIAVGDEVLITLEVELVKAQQK